MDGERMLNTDWCIHYNGILGRAGEPGPRERRCKAGVLYDSVRQPGSIPCISEGDAECALREFPTQAQVDAHTQAATERLMQHHAVIAAGFCPHCGAAMKQRRIGRCQYAEPCGHRLNEIPLVIHAIPAVMP